MAHSQIPWNAGTADSLSATSISLGSLTHFKYHVRAFRSIRGAAIVSHAGLVRAIREKKNRAVRGGWAVEGRQ